MAVEAWLALAPAAGPSPLVLDSPHSGADYPDSFRFLPPLSRMRRAEDAHVDRLLDGAPALGAPLLAARFPRTFIDVNRAVHDLDPALLDGDWPDELRPGPKTRLGRGLVWRTLGRGEAIYEAPLAVAEVRHRIDACYRPYHAALAGLLDAAHAAFGQAWHLNMHSMASVGGRMAPDGFGAVRPDFALGDRDGDAASARFTETVAGLLTGMGYRVAVNRPYRGAELVRRHGRPAVGRHSLQIEINRGLYMDERRMQLSDGLPRLAADLDRLVAALLDWARREAGRS